MKSEHDFKYTDDWEKYQRQYYAGLAMQGLLANHLGAMAESGRVHSPGSVERIAVMHADALIEELNKEAKP